MYREGQVFSTDFIGSAFIFIILLNIGFMAWNTAYDQQSRFTEQKMMRQEAFQTSRLLVRTPGHPPNWTSSDVKIVGLAEPDHVIQESKLEELDSMGYDQARAALGLGRTEFLLNVTSESYEKSIGLEPSNPENLVVEDYPVLVNTTNVFERGRLRLVLWE